MGVPDIFLKETITSVGQYIIEEPFYPLPSVPSPILSNIDSTTLPPLLGYNGTTAKNTSRQVLITPQGDPLLATWQYGLGRAAVWTSDLKGKWAAQWINWGQFPRFSAQLINWVLPTPQSEGLDAKVFIDENDLIVQLEAADSNGYPLNFLNVEATIVDPKLQINKITLDQFGAGKYQAKQTISQSGVYLVRLGANRADQSLGQITLGLTAPYSPEYKNVGIDKNLLTKLANTTGGEQINNPEGAFIHNLPSESYPREIWHGLLILVVILFPLDVAIRRLIIRINDLQKIRIWLHQILPAPPKIDREMSPRITRLFQARQRVRDRSGVNKKEEISISATETEWQKQRPFQEIGDETSPPKQDDTVINDTQEDVLKRLHDAKKRARR
jgi:hypothetical protein